MSRWLKRVVYLIFTFVLLIILAVIALVVLVDPNHYRAALANQVQRVTGRPFVIQGALHWTFFPWLGISADKLQLGNPVGFAENNFLVVQQANISLAFNALLKGEIRFGKLTLNGVELHLIKNTQGNNNWTFKSAVTDNPIPATANQSRTFSWREKLGAQLKNKLKYSMVAISALDIHHAKLSYQDLTSGQQWVINDFSLHTQNVGLNQVFPLTLEMTLLNKDFAKPISVQWQSEIQLQPQDKTVYFNHFIAHIDNLVAQGKLVAKIKPTFALQGNVSVPDFNMQTFLHNFAKSGGPEVFQRMAASFLLKATPEQLQIENLHSKINNSQLSGAINLQWQKQKNLYFNLMLDQWGEGQHPSRMVSSPAFASTSPTPTVLSNNPLLPLAVLRAWQVQGQLTIGQLHLAQLVFNQLSVPIQLQQGILDIRPLRGQIYGGQLQSNIKINTQAASPSWKITTHLQQIDINAFLSSIKKFDTLKISGKGNVDADLTLQGNTTQQLFANLNGKIQFAVQNGILHGLDIIYYSELANALANKQQPTYPNTKQTPFQQLQGTVQLVNGVAHNQDLLIQMPKLRATGKGSANLATEQLDYTLLLQRLTSGSQIQTRGPGVPLKLTGNFANPKISLDWQALIVEQAKQQLKDQLDKKIGAVTGDSQLGQQLQQGLQVLLGA